MTIRPAIALLAALAVLASAPALADTAHPAKKKRVVRQPATQQGQIACDASGCHRIPPNCRIEGTVLDWQGDPTGIDAVYCR